MTAELFLYVILVVGAVAYALLGGADFGAGIWEVLLGFRMKKREQGLLDRSIGPVWEANHVWLVLVVVVLFSAFPPAFEAVARSLSVPLVLALVMIILRGTAFVFRISCGKGGMARFWSVLFAVSSLPAPFFLGAAAFALVEGSLSFSPGGLFLGDPWAGWVHPLSLAGGLFAVALSALVSAVVLARDAMAEGKDDLAEAWRHRGMLACGVFGVIVVLVPMLLHATAPVIWDGFRVHGWPAGACAVVGTLVAMGALGKRCYRVALAGVVAGVAGIPVAVAVALHPWIVPGHFDLGSSKAPQEVLHFLTGAILLALVVVLPLFVLLYVVFKKRLSPASAGE